MSESFSWGGYPNIKQTKRGLNNRFDVFPESQTAFLPYGLGRSYGDSCLCSEGTLLSSASLKNFIAFDQETGVLCCEAGVSLAEIIDVCLPQGWFLPVTPGTKYVTVGGAIGNDVHGKNHHVAASFGNHVLRFELLRSDGSRLICSEDENAQWFHATIGGLGLTGFILWAEIQLKPVTSRALDTESIKYGSLNDFFKLSEDSEQDFEYTVAWLDCLAKGEQLGRGHFIRGNHSQARDLDSSQPLAKKGKLTFPIKPPVSLVNSLSLKAFNQLYYHRQQQEKLVKVEDYDPFFYPLDGILHWNRMYGKQGFMQHQCVIPLDAAEEGIREMLKLISASGLGSFLVVLKMMGDKPSKGLMSFCQPGATLAIDFPNRGKKTLDLLSRLDDVVQQASGKIYPAKDARMSAELFQQSYPAWEKIESLRDPAITSDFWQRVTKA